MFNARQLNKTDGTETDSGAQHFLRFSVDFRTLSDLRGNISEPLIHSQSERLHEDEPSEREVAAEESEAGAGTDLESAGSVAGPSGARWDDEGRAPAGTADADAGSSVTRWNGIGRVSLEGAVPRGTGTSGTRDASHVSGWRSHLN